MASQQRYFCKDCKKYFQTKKRPDQLERVIWNKYIYKRQTLKNLAEEYGKSINWVRSKIEAAKALKKEVQTDGYVFIADCTFFGRAYGFIVFRAFEIQKNVYVKSLMYESIADNQAGRIAIQKQGFKIKAMVLDGRPGVRNLFSDVPVQMCHFHQKQIIQRYLTTRPILPASIELKIIADTLANSNEKEFSKDLFSWHDKWSSFLKERTTDPITGHWHYIHKRTRSAFRSLKNNLPYLFTYKKYPELNIPNTTNSLEGKFAHLKEKVGIHRGTREPIKRKMIEDILRN